MTARRTTDWGTFDGDLGDGSVSATWWRGSNHRNMTIDRDIWFVDMHSKVVWSVNAGDTIDGASIPWFFRRLYPIYVGRYRRASVFHDVACTKKNRPSLEVHRMFYEAMRCDGVGPIQAWLMWAAVRAFGPRFKGESEDG